MDELNKINGLSPATKWIPESDMYRLIMRSNKAEAEKFQDWVVEDVDYLLNKFLGIIQPKEKQNDDVFIVTCCRLLRGFILKWNEIGTFFK